MITTRKEYLYYLEADRIALSKPAAGERSIKVRLADWLFPDEVYRFQRTLRKLEYLKNVRPAFYQLTYFFVLKRYYRLSYKLGFTIPVNVFGPGLSIAHYGTIIVNTGTKVGANCRLHANVNIGTAAGHASQAPQIGDNVYIGPGAKLFGAISIASNTVIGANAVVNKNIAEENCVYAGIPSKKIAEQVDIDDVLIRATDILQMNLQGIRIAGLPARELKELLKKSAHK
jgi:serine O-acetyltransferase